MKRSLLVSLFLLAAFGCASAKSGYRIQIKFTDLNLKDSTVYLAHYFGVPLPKIYKADSAKFDKNGVATLKSDKQTLGGIYVLLLSDGKTYLEFLLNDGDDISITATASKLPTGIQFKGSPDNERFQQYIAFLQDFGERQKGLQAELNAAKTKSDTQAVQEKARAASKELTDYRKRTAAAAPGTLLASIFNALEIPQVPEGDHFLPNGRKDSAFAYNYYKGHYWDGFNFGDDRLIHTPIYDAKLDEYMNKLVLQYPDSVIKEGDSLLAKTRGQKELFKYTLWWLTRNAEQSKVMGMDQVFVHLVENYYMKGDAYWLESEALTKYFDRAQKIAPNIIGNLAPDIQMTGADGKPHRLYDVKAKYTVVVFWDPTCGHCTKEVPAIDSVYRAVLKERGVKVFSVRTEGDEKKWREYIAKFSDDWTHVFDPERRSDYRAKYDVYSTPVVYLLDEKKIIRGKKLDHSNILSVIEMVERMNKSAGVGG